MVIGLLPSLQSADEAISNLVEAEFNEYDISLVGNQPTEVAQVHDAAGPFKHTSPIGLAEALHKYGIQNDVAQNYEDKVKSGNVFIAIACEDVAEDAACEMLTDAGATRVQIAK